MKSTMAGRGGCLSIRVAAGMLAWAMGSALAAPFAYIPNASNTVTVVDLATRAVVATVPVGTSPRGIAVNPAGNTVYVATGGNALSVIDAITNTNVATIPVGTRPTGVAVHPDGTFVYVTHQDGVDATVGVVEAASRTMVARIGANRYPYGIAIDPTGAKAYVSHLTPSVVDVLDLPNRTLQSTVSISTGVQLEGVALDPAGARLYVAKIMLGSQLYVVNTSTQAVVASVTLPSDAHQVAVDAAGTRAYVAMTSGVAVVNTATNTLVTTIPVSQPTGIAVHPAGTFVYAIDGASDQLRVIDPATNAVVDSIAVGHLPAAFGDFIGPSVITAAPVPPGTNWALAANGGAASASSTYGAGFPPSAAIDGDRAGRNWGNGSGWNDATPNVFPDALQVRFDGTKNIDRVVVYTVQDNATSPVEPTDTMTFSDYGIVDFTVEGWTGTSWVLLGRVSGNNLVKRTLTFPPVAIDRVYVNVTATKDGYSNITELEAWSSDAASQSNVALASAGATAFASSEYSPGFSASSAIDGDRAGLGWGDGSGWNDGTFGAWPDWMQVVFNGMKTIDRVVVCTLQDDATNPVEPTDTMHFNFYGIEDFSLEGWTGTAWVPLGRVSGNNLVKRTVTFPPVTVDRVFINVTRSLGGYSHITELEAWGR